jgi:hypothetical protein
MPWSAERGWSKLWSAARVLVQTAPVAGPKPAGKDRHARPVWGKRSVAGGEIPDEGREPELEVDHD